MTSCPGLFTVSDLPSDCGTRAAMESESFPPSMHIPSSIIMSLNADATSYIFGPSPGSFAAHIQLPDTFMESMDGIFIHMRFVTASATASLPMMQQLAGSPASPLRGCSPIDVAQPVTLSGLCAKQAKLANGVCNGPTHCCCATRPVTDLSTLLVRKRLEPTDTNLSTPIVNADSTVKPAGSINGFGATVLRSIENVLGGIFPNTFSKGRSTGVELSCESRTTTLPSPETVPTTAYGTFSRLQILSKSSCLSAGSKRALFSWNSAVHSSSNDMDGSPTSIFLMSMTAPTGSAISLSTLPEPPAP
mmetsp:Transcript_48791/g.89989  ORF Transcript_48791/g.89989 Transcript_48791/m.89989 type:complete len:304 (-) Transcript_48791:1575-2486(-)